MSENASQAELSSPVRSAAQITRANTVAASSRRSDSPEQRGHKQEVGVQSTLFASLMNAAAAPVESAAGQSMQW